MAITARRAKAKQQDLPTMEKPDYPVLDQWAVDLYDTQQERMMLQQKEQGLRSNIRIKMEELQLRKYALPDGKYIELDAPEPKAYIRKGRSDNDDADVRNTEENIIEPLKAAATPSDEPTTEESQANAAAFLGKGKKAKAVAAAEPEPQTEPEAAPVEVAAIEGPLPDAPKDMALWLALNNRPESAEHWSLFRNQGNYDSHRLTNAIKQEFESGSPIDDNGIQCAYRSEPLQFYFGKLKSSGKPTLEGARLLAEVRRVMQLPAPKKVSVKQ